MEENNYKIPLHQDEFDNNSKKVKGKKERKKSKERKKERETILGVGGTERINFRLEYKVGPTVWAVLPADRIAQKTKWALYKYYTTADNEVAYFHIKCVILPEVLKTALSQHL